MNKVQRNLFFINLVVIQFGILIFVLLIQPSFSNYPVLIIFGVLLTCAVSFASWRIFQKPIQEIKKIIENLAQGNFQEHIRLSHKDEFGELADNLNQMSIELQNRVKETIRDKSEIKAIVSSMIEGVIVVGKDERILLLNAPVYTMLELRSRETIGRPYWEVIRHQEINSFIKEAMATKSSLVRELTIISPEETHFSVQVSSVVLESGYLLGVVAVFHDITELKKLARLRSEFVANVSHELKTPLTTIKGFVETLKEGAINDRGSAIKFLEIIAKHTERLENLVNDLLSLSAIESREVKLNREKISVNAFLEAILNLYKERFENQKLNIHLKLARELPSILADRNKIEQVFFNLIDNAIKFTPPGGSIIINSIQQNGFIQIDVKDTGIGIESEHLPRIFERFYRVDRGRSRELGGTGLGLSIVKHIVQLHQGKVSVESEPQAGSTFSIFLPVCPS